MLSVIGRAAVRRVGAGSSHTSTNGVLQSILQLQRVAISNNVQFTFALRQFSSSLLRAYATTTQKAKPKAKVAAKPKSNKPATKKPSPKKAAKKAAKKPVKKPVKRKPKKKVSAKPKARAASKKKVPTEKQKERAAKQKKLATLKAVKAAILTPPKSKPASAWAVLVQESTVGVGGQAGIGSRAKDASAKYKSLSPEDLEHYNHIANQNKLDNELAQKKWIESHSPEEIRRANVARRRGVKKLGRRMLPSLKDPRLPKGPRASWLYFNIDRWGSGDLKGMQIAKAGPLISKEWRELSPSQRKPYDDLSAADKRRYEQEYKTVFGREPVRRAVKA